MIPTQDRSAHACFVKAETGHSRRATHHQPCDNNRLCLRKDGEDAQPDQKLPEDGHNCPLVERRKRRISSQVPILVPNIGKKRPFSGMKPSAPIGRQKQKRSCSRNRKQDFHRRNCAMRRPSPPCSLSALPRSCLSFSPFAQAILVGPTRRRFRHLDCDPEPWSGFRILPATGKTLEERLFFNSDRAEE
jgi:hypothetical protein